MKGGLPIEAAVAAKIGDPGLDSNQT